MATKKLQIVGSMINTDETLTKTGVAADAAAVGSAINAMEEQIDNIEFPVSSVNGQTGEIQITEVPSCTLADNGKFLRVVNGEIVWSTVPNAEEVGF